MYINQSMEGRRCGRSSSVWSVGESSSVRYVSAGEPLRCDASISTDPVTLGSRLFLGGLSATAARWSPNCAGEFRPGVDAGVDCGLRSKGGVRAAAAMRGSGGDTKGFVDELSSINGAWRPWDAPDGPRFASTSKSFDRRLALKSKAHSNRWKDDADDIVSSYVVGRTHELTRNCFSLVRSSGLAFRRPRTASAQSSETQSRKFA